jgi:MFS family permease
MFRWVQGIGGCGIVSIVHFVFFELLPPTKWAANMGMVTVVMALALTTGPLIGGAIASTHQWRWIFLFK